MQNVIEFSTTRYIVKVYGGGFDLCAMRKTKRAAEELLQEHGGNGEIIPIEKDNPWYNGVC